MAPVSVCPDVATWQQLLQGQLPPPEAEVLEEHLAGCAACLQTVRQIPADNTLEIALRSHSTPAEGAMPPVIQRLMDRLKQLHPSGLPAQEATIGASSEESPPGPQVLPAASEQTQEGFDFLAPPAGPGEIGRLGGYRILKVLGQGGMGVVFQAQDLHLERLVALKAMRPSVAANPAAKQRFLREAKACAALKHDHVVTIHQVGEDNGVPFIAMEFLEGMPLDEWLAKGRKATVPQILRIGREVARGLAAAHDKGLIHRDIKPGNIWLDKDAGRVKILDFGLARTQTENVNITQSGAVVGTPAYMAPEQARAEAVDGRCDLFSLGCVLYRLCTGHVPFKGDTTMAVLMSLALETPKTVHEINPAIPEALSELIAKLLQKDAKDRPASAKDVIKAIQSIEGTLSGSRTAVTAPMAPAAMPVANPFSDLTEAGSNLVVPQKAPASGGRQPPEKASPAPTRGANAPRSANRRKLLAAAALVLVLGGALLGGWLIIRDPKGNVIASVRVPSTYSTEHVPDDKSRPADTGPDSSPLFNGKDLAGWVVLGGSWRFENGALIYQAIKEDRTISDNLVSKRTFRDFELRFQARLKGAGAIAGVVIRGLFAEGKVGTVKGHQCVMGGRYWGNFAELGAKLPSVGGAKKVKTDDFNDYSIRCVGKHITIKVNGETTIDAELPTPDEGILAWHVPAMTRLDEAVFRNIEFTNLTTAPAPADVPAAATVPALNAWQAQHLQKTAAKEFAVPVVAENSIGMTLALIPPGKFLMGATGNTVEEPVHEVTISKPTYMGAHEVSVGQFRKFIEETKYEIPPGGKVGPSVAASATAHWTDPGWKQEDSFPVVCVSWHDAQAFCAWLSKKEGHTYRLPTEAEWEYACRAGSQKKLFIGDGDTYLDDYAWHGANGQGRAHPVGEKKPNPWGLYDIYGNVWEWCQDNFDGKGYPPGAVVDPAGPEAGANRMIRGGGWTSGGRSLWVRSAYRFTYAPTPPELRFNGLGFRVVRTIEPKAPEGAAKSSAAPLGRVLAKLKAGQPVTVVTMGDSLTAGTQWPTLLQQKLQEKYKSEVTLVNGAVGGTKLTQGLETIPTWLAKAPEPDLVTICFGYNDLAGGAAAFEKACDEAVERIRRETNGKADVLFMTTVPAVARWTTMAELAEASRRVAKNRNAGLADTEKAFLEAGQQDKERLYVPDKVHLSEAGHELVARTVLEAIEKDGQTGAWTPLFNGTDLTGWVPSEGKWTVKKGELASGDTVTTLFYTGREFKGDFHLRAEVKIENQAKGGFLFRLDKAEKTSIKTGYKALLVGPMNDNPLKTGSLDSGDMPLVAAPVADVPLPAEQWIDFEVIVRGNTIRILVNGRETVNYTDIRASRPRGGFLALRQMQPGLAFRKVEIREWNAANPAAGVP